MFAHLLTQWAKSGARFQPTCSLSPSPREWGEQNSQGSPHSWVQLLGSERARRARERKGTISSAPTICRAPPVWPQYGLISNPDLRFISPKM